MDDRQSKLTPGQFSLRTLIILVTMCACVCAAVAALGFDLTLEFSGFALSCVFVCMVSLALFPLDFALFRLPWVVSFAITPILYGLLSFVFFFFGQVIDQPHPVYAQGNWFTVAMSNYWQIIPVVATVVLILVAIDAAIQFSRPRDVAYYPRVWKAWRSLSSLPTRMILIVGITLALGYYCATVIEMYGSSQQPHGLLWPPQRVFVTCNLLWGTLWLADCSARRKGGTIAAVIGYLCFNLLLLPMGFGVLVE